MDNEHLNANELPGYVSATTLCEFLSISKPSLYRLVHRGKLAPPIRLAPNTSRWSRQAVIEYLEARVADSAAERS